MPYLVAAHSPGICGNSTLLPPELFAKVTISLNGSQTLSWLDESSHSSKIDRVCGRNRHRPTVDQPEPSCKNKEPNVPKERPPLVAMDDQL